MRRRVIVLTIALVFALGLCWGSYNVPLAYATQESITVESPHPYSNYYDNTWTITRSNAIRMRVHFDYIKTESGYDYVYVKNSTTTVNTYDGTYDDTWSNWVGGNTIQIRLTSDGSITDDGFVVNILEYVTAGNYSINLRTLDWSESILPSCNVTISGIGSTVSNSLGWANFTGVSNGTYVITTRWQGNTVNQTSIPVSGADVTTDLICRVYDISFANSFRDSSGNTLYTNPSNFSLIAPNGTTTPSLSLGSYKLQNGSFYWNNITWQGSNVATSASFDPTNGNPTVNCTIYSLGIVFKNATGTSTLTPSPSSITLTAPNGTSLTRTTFSYGQVQNGTYTLTRIVWRGSNVVPSTSPNTTLTSDYTWSVNCSVWDLTISARDGSGSLLTPSTTQIHTTLPNGTSLNQTGVNPVTNTVMNGTFYFAVKWQGSWVYGNTSASLEPYAAGATATGQYPTTTGDIDDTRSDGYYGRVYVYVYTADGDTLDVTITGYNVETSAWDTLASQIDGGSGVILDTTFAEPFKYSSIRAQLDDTEDNDNIYYTWNYTYYTSRTLTLYTSHNLSCSVYSLSLSFYDNTGNITIDPTQIIIEAPNGTLQTTTAYSYPQAQNGTWAIRQAKWCGNNAVPTPNPSLTLTADTTWSVNCSVYSISLANAFRDSVGNTLYTPPSNLTLVCPNGTSLTNPDISQTWLLQNGTYTVKNITWLDQDITPTPAPTFDPKDGTPALYLEVAFYNNMEEPLDWPMFHHDPSHAGYSTSTLPDTMGVTWTYTTGGSISQSSPAVVDGRVYVGSNDYSVYCLNVTTGEKIWSYKTGGYIYSSPAVAGGIVYFGSTDNNVYALNASTGGLKWEFDTDSAIYSSPTFQGSNVYVAAGYSVYCLNATTGDEIWSNYIGSYMYYSSPAVAYDKVYVGAGSYVYALNSGNGSVAWSYYTEESMYYSSPSIYEGKLYIGGYDYLYCLNAYDGAYLWSYSTGSSTYPSPAVVDGKVYFSSGYSVYCLDADDGGYVWDHNIGEYAYYSSPAVADGKVYVGAGYYVYALNASTGDHLWSYETGGYVYSSPAIADDMVYVGSNDKKVYALGPIPKYSLTFQFMDNTGTDDLTDDISWILVQAPNGTVMNLTSYTLPQAEGGDWIVRKIVYVRTNVVPTPNPGLTLTSNTTWTIDCRIYATDFTNAFKDSDGDPLSPDPSGFTLLWPTGEETSEMTVGAYYMPNGTWTWYSIIWEGSDVVPSYTTFDPADGDPVVNCRVYKTDFSDAFRDQDWNTFIPEYFQLLCPNGTVTGPLDPATYPLQYGTYEWDTIMWEGENITDTVDITTFNPADGDPAVRCTVGPIQPTLSCRLSSLTITEGGGVTVSGTITPPVPEIEIQFRDDGNVWGPFKVRPGPDGKFSYTWKPPHPGQFKVEVSWGGDEKYEPSEWAETLNVNPKEGPPPPPIGIQYIVPPAIIFIVIIAVAMARRRRRPPPVVVPAPPRPPPPVEARVSKVRRALERLEGMQRQGRVSAQVYQDLRSEYEAELRDLERRLGRGR